MFALPILISALIEAPLALVSDRIERKRLLGLGLAALGGALTLAALADRPWLLALGLSLAGAASGLATLSAEAELIARHPGRSEHAMSRWAMAGAAGDVLAPLAVGAVLACGGSYRSALLVVASLLVAHALLVLRRSRPRAAAAARSDSEPEPLRAALGNPRLWALLCGAAACTLLDEIVVALAALRLARDLGAGPVLTAASLVIFSLGSFAGAAATEALLPKRSPRALLAVSAAGSLVALALLVLARSAAEALPALLLLGASAAPHWPLLQAAAYDAAPGRPGLVNAAAQAFVVLEIVLPLAVGAIAARLGLAVALAALSAQSLLVLAAAVVLIGRRAKKL